MGRIRSIANRTDFDLKAHSAASGKDLSFFDQEKNERWTPFVIEPAAGVDRATLTFLMDAFTEMKRQIQRRNGEARCDET